MKTIYPCELSIHIEPEGDNHHIFQLIATVRHRDYMLAFATRHNRYIMSDGGLVSDKVDQVVSEILKSRFGVRR